MNAKKLNRGLTPKLFLVAAVLAFSSSANAALVTQLIHFDDASNGWNWYSDADLNFLFDPTNLQSSTLCADSTSGGNGSCVIEGTQGVLPLMTRPETGPQSQGESGQQTPIVSGALEFTLDSFYFLLTGNGTGAANAITATGSNGATTTLQQGGIYTDPDVTGAVTFYELVGSVGDPAGVLDNQIGYIASFGTLFENVTSIQFSAPTSAQVRLDCVVATFDGMTTEPLASGTNCGVADDNGGGGPGGVPIPAPLALIGLGGLFLSWSIRKKRA